MEPNDAFAITLVAVAGFDIDWECYAGVARTLPYRIATNGDKVPIEFAGAFTQVMQLRHYR